jgi:hypothetical protein
MADPQKLRDDERGATAVIVVLILIALCGMIVLTVDVGQLLFQRRGMVNASDAAALAAAQSCAGLDDADVPEAMADAFAANNVGNVITAVPNIRERPGCDSLAFGHVTVEYGMNQDLFFAGVLGFDGPASVRTAATAGWGPTGGGSVIPLVIYERALQGPCDVPNVDEGTTCYIWEANDFGVGGGNFGFLDVGIGWNVAKNARCENSGGQNQVADWIRGGPVETSDLNYPNATWVCTREGEGGNNQTWQALEELKGQTRDFPIIGISPADGEPAFISSPQSKYNVIGFAHFEIVDVRMASKIDSGEVTCSGINRSTPQPVDLMECVGAPSDATYEGPATFSGQWGSSDPQVDADGLLTWTGDLPNGNRSVKFRYSSLVSSCGGVPPPAGNNSAHCLVLEWHGATFGGTSPGGGADFGLRAIRLCDIPIGSCPEQD